MPNEIEQTAEKAARSMLSQATYKRPRIICAAICKHVEPLEKENAELKAKLEDRSKEIAQYANGVKSLRNQLTESQADWDVANFLIQEKPEFLKKLWNQMKAYRNEATELKAKLEKSEKSYVALRSASMDFTGELWAHVPECQLNNPPVREALKKLQDARVDLGEWVGKEYKDEWFTLRKEIKDLKAKLGAVTQERDYLAEWQKQNEGEN